MLLMVEFNCILQAGLPSFKENSAPRCEDREYAPG